MVTYRIPRIVHSILFLILAAGCDDEQVDVVKCYPDKGYHNTDHSAWTQYYYNTEKKVTSSIYIGTFGPDSTQLTTYTYDANGNMISLSYGDGGTFTFFYNDKNQMVESVYVSGDVTSKGLYEYNPSGQLITVSSPTGESQPISVTTYVYPNTSTNNPSAYTFTTDNVIISEVHSIEYDNKPNPYRLLFPYPISDNNVVKETVVIPAQEQTYTYTYTYVYNRHGYPKSFALGDPEMITYICE